MQVEITTLGAGTYDVGCDDKDEKSLRARINKETTSGPWMLFNRTGGVPILINTTNGVSIKRKR